MSHLQAMNASCEIETPALAVQDYGPGHSELLSIVIERMSLANDAALSRVLEIDQATVSRIRKRRAPVSATLLIRIHKLTDMGIREMEAILDRKN